jgi:HK97 gp10 family phage protein
MPNYAKYQWKTSAGIVKYGGKVGGVSLDTSLLDAMSAEIEDKASLLIEDVGNEITSDVYRLAPEDTGELKDSYLRESGMTGKLTFTIRDGVPYGIFQELGTSKMAAQPHVIPAIEAGEAELVTAFTELFK